MSDAPPRTAEPVSRYLDDVLRFACQRGAKAAYCFVLDGDKGTGGCPVVIGTLDRDEYLRRCRALIMLLRRSADLLEQDIGGPTR